MSTTNREKEEGELMKVREALNGRLESHDRDRELVQAKLKEVCDGLRKQIDELEERINDRIKENFTTEDNRLQAVFNEVNTYNPEDAGCGSDEKLSQLIQKAKAELLVKQTYEIKQAAKGSVSDLKGLYDLEVGKALESEWFDTRKATGLKVTGVSEGRVCLEFSRNPYEEAALAESNLGVSKALLCKKGETENGQEYTLEKEGGFSFLPDVLEAEAEYTVQVRTVCNERASELSDSATFATPGFNECCVWKACPGSVSAERKYFVNKRDARVAAKLSEAYAPCTILGTTALPRGQAVAWGVKVSNSHDDNGFGIRVGVAPFDVDQDQDDPCRSGWYFDCFTSALTSGPPHNAEEALYGPRKWEGEYVHTGDVIGVAMDMAKGVLSFVLNGVNYGAAFEGVPLDRPLVPSVVLECEDDCVKLKGAVLESPASRDVAAPLNVAVSAESWDAARVSWDAVEGAEHYQVECNGGAAWGVSAGNSFRKTGLSGGAEYAFRVRAVRGREVGEWSAPGRGRTPEAPDFAKSAWRPCPDSVDWELKYAVDAKNPRVASVYDTEDNTYAVVLGDTPVPLGKVVCWSIRVLKSWNNDGYYAYVGVAPFNINQNVDNSYGMCGWYLHCFDSKLHSGPPHNYDGKEYGPRKGEGQYVHTGDSVGVVMDTTKGTLSFVLDGVDCGVAYEGIPLDAPLLPCVHLGNQADSIELVI